MDRLTHRSINNAIKEIEALDTLIAKGVIEVSNITDCLQEICWNLSNMTGRRNCEYISDEFQYQLKSYIKKTPAHDEDDDE